ncbi:hypothetical protein DPEC_G00206010 [Dallia pectoralis]|uniref:Uncharacterized protein n=1 Tax=Dallia pectoralis TaxID=75939 RepID=A0ACC2G491_DALPE|nr:hypothetical protein DPEC_G00206010 [Dallia pectoralis]
MTTESQRRLLSHFQSLQPSSDQNRTESDLPQLNSPDQKSINKEKSPFYSALCRPWWIVVDYSVSKTSLCKRLRRNKRVGVLHNMDPRMAIMMR